MPCMACFVQNCTWHALLNRMLCGLYENFLIWHSANPIVFISFYLLSTIHVQLLVFPVFEGRRCIVLSFYPADIWNDQKGDRMLHLKRRMIMVVLMILSAIAATALTPGRVALRPVPVSKTRFPVTRRRK